MSYKLLPEISDKQREIVDYVFKFRFINRKQLQTILNHKDPRRINTWLKDLVEKNYLGRIYSHKLLENTKPAVFFLSHNGITLLKREPFITRTLGEIQTKDVKKFYQDAHASDTYKQHCIFVCDLYIDLKHHEINSDWEYEFNTKTELCMFLTSDAKIAEKRKYIPDVHIYKLNKTYDNSTSYLLEVFDVHTPFYFLEYKVRSYLKLYDEDWSDYGSIDQKFPKILFIFPNETKLHRTKQFLIRQLEYRGEDDIIFKFSTYEKIKTHGLTNLNAWEEIKCV